jgi:hypothetical protein
MSLTNLRPTQMSGTKSGRRGIGKCNLRQGKIDLSFGGNALNVVMLFFPKRSVTEENFMRSAVDAERI